ncbi:MAG: tape measure protein [Bacteroidales bacterium]|nr:tape measure protein [Bacteroidales bacterium]MBR0052306.1 tape measure protein [Bacteroidales bacterium]
MNKAQYIIDIGTSGDRQAVSRLDAVQGKLNAVNRSAGLTSRLVRGLGDAFRTIPGAEFFTNPIVAMTAGVGVVTKLGMETEKTATAFNVLVGNESKAAKMLGEINKYADETLWDRAGTQEAAKTMLGFGVSAESVVGDLKMLGDVAMGDNNRLQQLALVFGQISAAGKLQGQDLLQLINAGYNPLLDISALTGKSVATLKDEMSKGLITFDMVHKAFERATGEGGKFNRMTEQIAQTSFGAFEQLKGKFLSALLELYEIIQPLVVPAIQALGKGIDLLVSIARPAINIVAVLGAGILAYNAAVAVSTAVTKGWTIATRAQYIALLLLEKGQKLVNLAMSLNPVGLIVAGIAALAAGVAVCWNKFAGFRAVILTVWDTIKGFGDALKQYVLDRLTGIVAGLGLIGEAFSRLVHGDFSGAAESAKSAFVSLSGLGAGGKAAASMRSVASGFGERYDRHLAEERAKRAAKDAIEDPKAAAGTGAAGTGTGTGTGTSSAKTTANAITTGGTRNTSIVLNIGKFFEDVNITNTDGRDLRQLQDAVLESINRSLEIATSAAR